jgi:hypothetical protein
MTSLIRTGTFMVLVALMAPLLFGWLPHDVLVAGLTVFLGLGAVFVAIVAPLWVLAYAMGWLKRGD